MTTLREAAKQALERLRKYHHGNGFVEDAECIAALEAALAQQEEPVGEPVAWLIEYDNSEREVRFVAGTRGITQTPLYAAAPTAEPVAWMTDRKEMYFDKDDAFRYSDSIIKPLYLSPPQRKPQTLDDAMQQPRVMAQAYENGYKAGAAAEREECAKLAESTICDTHLLTGVRIYGTRAAAVIRARGNT